MLLRLCRSAYLLGHLGVQDRLRAVHAAICRPSGPSPHHTGHDAAIFASERWRKPELPASDDGLLSVCFRCHYTRARRWRVPSTHELPRMDDLRTALADLQLLPWRVQSLGRRLSVQLGCHGLFRWLCHSPELWYCRLRGRLVDRPAVEAGPRELPAEQCPAHDGWCGYPMDWLERIQWWCRSYLRSSPSSDWRADTANRIHMLRLPRQVSQFSIPTSAPLSPCSPGL